MPSITDIVAYENGELDTDSIINLFAGLVKTGVAWTLQGHYGRFAMELIKQGYLNEKGDIL